MTTSARVAAQPQPETHLSRIGLPTPQPILQTPPSQYVGATQSSSNIFRPIPIIIQTEWAPAWFYSALGWLGKSYFDANRTQQQFEPLLIGSDVDPYAKVGSTRLFIIEAVRSSFRLLLATDVNNLAVSVQDALTFTNTDAGILQMYQALKASSIFPAVKFCYLFSGFSSDLVSSEGGTIRNRGSGYDPNTGLRLVVFGTALTQVVPLTSFINGNNEQIYEDSPTIVPFVTALVYDVTANNAIGAKTFTLPIFYTCDRISVGNYYVNRFQTSVSTDTSVSQCGQTVIFPNGPGYDKTKATALTLESTTQTRTAAGSTIIISNYDTATVVSTEEAAGTLQLGVVSLTYSSGQPSAIFAQQNLIGFYRDSTWDKCLGVPIYDYGTQNSAFSSSSSDLVEPTLIYDPAYAFLNGGALPNVLRKIAQATYIYPPDQLVEMLRDVISAKATAAGVGLSVTTAALKPNITSPTAGPILDHLDVPINLTVMTYPPLFDLPRIPFVNGESNHVTESISIFRPPPTSVQAGLTAQIPLEALTGTGINSLEIGTLFPQQDLGDGGSFEHLVVGTVVNLMNRQNGTFAIQPIDVSFASLSVDFATGVYYVASLTGLILKLRGSDGSVVSTEWSTSAVDHTFVGAFIYTAASTSIRLYATPQLALAPPAVGTNGILEGETYSVRLIVGDGSVSYDIIDSTQTLLQSNIRLRTPVPTDGSELQLKDIYFGSFIGGATEMIVWSVPLFLIIKPSRLPSTTSFVGTMMLEAQASGSSAYQLQITDSSLFVYSNINVDTGLVGSVSATNVFLASAVINSAPDDGTSMAFTPSTLLMGLIRQVRLGNKLVYVFISMEDSIVIGSVRYVTSVIELGNLGLDLTKRPYPPAYWPKTRYWQLANRHNPYLDVAYEGKNQADRIGGAQKDTARIGLKTAQAQEPMQMYLDTKADGMVTWPINEFPYASSSQTVDTSRFSILTEAILNLIKTAPEAPPKFVAGPLDSEKITVPEALQLSNPYVVTSTTLPVVDPSAAPVSVKQTPSTIIGKPVVNLGQNVVAAATPLSEQLALADEAILKSTAPVLAIAQTRSVREGTLDPLYSIFEPQLVYGYSVFNPTTGEAYLVELVDADTADPDHLPNATQNITYDPYYVRIVFLNTFTCYNMSIIVPSMAHDQYGHFARQGTSYKNLLSSTDELGLGYMYSLYDTSNNFDNVNLTPYPPPTLEATLFQLAEGQADSQSYIFTNQPYSATQNVLFNPVHLFGNLTGQLDTIINNDSRFVADLANSATAHQEALGSFSRFPISSINYIIPQEPPLYFVCRRQNWKAECHLLQASRPAGKSIYLAFGGGDIVPLNLDASVPVDKRFPAYMKEFTYTFADQAYASVRIIAVGNTPYVVAVTKPQSGQLQYMNFSINSTAGSTSVQTSLSQKLTFPRECFVVGQASTTLTSMTSINATLGTLFTDTGGFTALDNSGNIIPVQQFQVIPYNNLVYLIRAVTNVNALGAVGGQRATSGLLVDTYVPTTSGNLTLAQGARHKRSGLSFFGSSYTPTTMVDTTDNLDFTSITGDKFYVPTLFIPIPELDAAKGFVAEISNFLGTQAWTFIYPEIVATIGAMVNGIQYNDGFNIDSNEKPILSLQKLQFVYDPLVIMFTPNDLTHRYRLQPKQSILALSNDQIHEGICWRSANIQPWRLPPTNISAQEVLPEDQFMDRPNIIYSPKNRPVITRAISSYLGMSVNSFISVSGTAYNIEESAMSGDQTARKLISQVSSNSNMLVSVLFDYDNNDVGTMTTYDGSSTTKGVVFLNGYLSGSGYAFSSPDHFDVNDVLPTQLPLLEQVTSVMPADWDSAFYNNDVSLPRQFWSLTYDYFTAPGLPNFITSIPPSAVDPIFSNRTRSLVLSLKNALRPTQLGLMDTYSSVVSANLHLDNGVTGSVFLNKKADRDILSIGTPGPNAPTLTSYPLIGLPENYDFFVFSRDHYGTLSDGSFWLIDQGYAMCLVDDGSGTGTKLASYFVDSDGDYNELYSYALCSSTGEIIETASFTLKVILGSTSAPASPNHVNPQDLAIQITRYSSLVYAVVGQSTPGQPPALLPIQTVSGAEPIVGPPGFNGYSLNVPAAGNQPLQISQIFFGSYSYEIVGSTTILPLNSTTQVAIPFYGSISNGLDPLTTSGPYSTADGGSIPRITVTAGPTTGKFGGNALGALVNTPFSRVFQGAAAIPAAAAAAVTNAKSIMRADDALFYTFNAITNTVMDSNGYPVNISGGQYFIDLTNTTPVYGVITLPYFLVNGHEYSFDLSTSPYTLIVANKSYSLDAGNASVTIDRTVFKFNAVAGGTFTVTETSIDSQTDKYPSNNPLYPFSITLGGVTQIVDVFNHPELMTNMTLGVVGNFYTYNPIEGQVMITNSSITKSVSLLTGITFASASGYGYVTGYSNNEYTVNGAPMAQYNALPTPAPASYALMTSPQMFTIDNNFYTIDKNVYGGLQSVTGNGQTVPINYYSFSILGQTYVINTTTQPYIVVGGGYRYPMTGNNTQFIIDGVQYTITYQQNSLYLGTISGQYNITQGNAIVVENYVYQLDTLNGQIVGNGTTYPLTTSGFTYTVTSSTGSFSVTTAPNATTVLIDYVVYEINNTTVVGDGVTYPILTYRTFYDGTTKYVVGVDGVVSVAPPIPVANNTFTDGTTYTINDIAAFDGTNYYRMIGNPSQFTASGHTYTVRTKSLSMNAGTKMTYIQNVAPLPTLANPSPTPQFTFGNKTIYYGRTQDVAAFDGMHYYFMTNNQFTDTQRNFTYTINGNTAIHAGNSYEIHSNLGQGSYFEVLNGPTYYINITVADSISSDASGPQTGDAYSVFPISGGQFTVPILYNVVATGASATVSSTTFTAVPTAVSTLKALAGSLTGGFFVDPVTGITYTCVNQGGLVSFTDSNNTSFLFTTSGTTPNTFVASVVVNIGVSVVTDEETPPAVFPILNGQFIVGSKTYSLSIPIAYQNADAGPYWPIVNGRFLVPQPDPISFFSYTLNGSSVTKGFVIDNDDQFSPDGNVIYTINAVSVTRATNQGTLINGAPNQILVGDAGAYSLNSVTNLASIEMDNVDYNAVTKSFTVSYEGVIVTYKIGPISAVDSRRTASSYKLTTNGSQLSFTDTIALVQFSWDSSGNNPIRAGFVYTNGFFTDTINGITYYVNLVDTSVQAISYLPESTRYAFTLGNGENYVIQYNNVGVVFPVISGSNVNAGITTIGADAFFIHVDQVDPTDGSTPAFTNLNSFEINGNLYTIKGTPSGANYSSCQVYGDLLLPRTISASNTFTLIDPTVVYTIQLNDQNFPTSITASFAVQPSCNLIEVNDKVYIGKYSTASTGTIIGQANSAIAITQSKFSLGNRFDSTVAKFTFADLNIYDSASVIGQFYINYQPSFTIGSGNFTFDPVRNMISDSNKRSYPLIANPTMFSINGSNYLIDTNRTPHAVVGNSVVSPLSTDVTVQSGKQIPNSTFTLNGLIYKYTEDAHHSLLNVTSTKSYIITQPSNTFVLDSSLVFTINKTPPPNTDYAGSTIPIGTVSAGTLVLNLYAGISESGGADFFTYKNTLYTVVQSGGIYLSAQKSYIVYAAHPTPSQQQLATFDLNGTTYMVTVGSSPGATAARGVNPGTLWSETAVRNTEYQFGLVYGFYSMPSTVYFSDTAQSYQFEVYNSNGALTTYDILFTAGSNTNVVKIDAPNKIPTFTQLGNFGAVPSYPLTLETGGYNAYTTSVEESSTPLLSYYAAYKTPVISTDPHIDTSLMTLQGDFSLEFWHSIPLSTTNAYHPFRYSSSVPTPLVYYVDVDFEDSSNIFIQINNTIMTTSATPPVFSTGWRHFALTYSQPYMMLCSGAGFEVKDGSNYDFQNDFSIVMRFSVSDVMTEQGLLYKGTASPVTSQILSKSYRVVVRGGYVFFEITDGDGANLSWRGPSISSGLVYDLCIVKATNTNSTNNPNNGTDPYGVPDDIGTMLANLANSDATATVTTDGKGNMTVTKITPPSNAPGQNVTDFTTPPSSYQITISVRTVGDDGTLGIWSPLNPIVVTPKDSQGMLVNSTGAGNILLGMAYDDSGTVKPLGRADGSAPGNLINVYLFSAGIDYHAMVKHADTGTSYIYVDVAQASPVDLSKAGLIGAWIVKYDPNGVVSNPFDEAAVAISSNSSPVSSPPYARLAGLSSHEYEGTSLYINGYFVRLKLVHTTPPPSMSTYAQGQSLLNFNAGIYRLAEMSIWASARQPYQIFDDMFGRLIPSNEALLQIYVSGSFNVEDVDHLLKPSSPPLLPMAKYIDNITPPVAGHVSLSFGSASLDLQGCPAVGRCGPLITPNLYTPPGTALTVCDTVPYLTTYSITLNSITDPSQIAGELNEAYVYINNGVLVLYAGKKVGDLILSWVSQEQGDVQVVGYIEGAPPCPMANLTNRSAYPGATAVTMSIPTSVTLKYENHSDSTSSSSSTWDISAGSEFGLGPQLAPFGFGVSIKKKIFDITADYSHGWGSSSGTTTTSDDASVQKLDEANRYTVRMDGTLASVTGDTFMASLNTQITPNSTPGNPSSRTAILPNPNLGGFTPSNAPNTPRGNIADEKFGSRMYVPSSYGQAFVTSQTLDVYQQTLLQSNTVYGFVRIPNADIPVDRNIVSFRMSSKYIRPGCLDGVIGYVYNPATLPSGQQTYQTSTGEMSVLNDKNFSTGRVGHEASYMRVVEAYKLKRDIDQQAFNGLALYEAAYAGSKSAINPLLTPGLDFYNEYVWSSRGGTQEVKHTYTTSLDEVYLNSYNSSSDKNNAFNVKVSAAYVGIVGLGGKFTENNSSMLRYVYNTTSTNSFDITASFEGIETDTQMRYGCANDAHFVMKNNSTYNSNNQSGLNLVIGSDGLVYNIVPSVSSGAGQPLSDDIDDSRSYMQPQPYYVAGNADGLSGSLEPYDRPGKTSLFRTYSYFLQPTAANATEFWNTVIDPVWLANSQDEDAIALRTAQGSISQPWRLLHRVTYSQRFLPPISNEAVVVPQITPIMAVPVLTPASAFLYYSASIQGPRSALNPGNDIEANIVVVLPTNSGKSAGSTSTTGQTVLPNNTIPFDIVYNATSIVNWGDSANSQLLSRLSNSILGSRKLIMQSNVLAGSKKLVDVMDPAKGGILYSIYTDPNGVTVNVPTNANITVHIDVNSNPIQYYDGNQYHSLQADYVASPDGTIMYYIQPPSTYDPTNFDLDGDYDLFGHPGDEWQYYLVSGYSSNMTSEPTVNGFGPFLTSSGYKGFSVATTQHNAAGANQVSGYILVQGMLQYPHLNTTSETFADVLVYKSMSLLDTFPIGDPDTLIHFLKALYPGAPFVDNAEINLVFAKNIISYFNTLQLAIVPS